MGGPYGAAVGLALGAGRHAGKFLTAAAVLLMLPVLFILMLPSLIFGGLISSGNSGQPILNDNAAIIQNTNDIAFAVNEILGEGITDAEARIAQDFAATSGDNYEIINPYASDMTSNTNSFIAQYCAAKGENWDTISGQERFLPLPDSQCGQGVGAERGGLYRLGTAAHCGRAFGG